MDPITMGIVSTVATIGGSLISARSQASAQQSEAAHIQEKAAIESHNADIRAKEEAALGQQKAGLRQREARLAQSSLVANAGASGASSSDKTVLDLWEGIQTEGQHNANMETAASASKASGISFQDGLNSWTADSQAAIKRSGAKSTMIGGVLGAIGTGMKGRYGGYTAGTSTRAYG